MKGLKKVNDNFSAFVTREKQRHVERVTAEVEAAARRVARGVAVAHFGELFPSNLVSYPAAAQRMYSVLSEGWHHGTSSFINETATAERIRAEVLPLIRADIEAADGDYLTATEVVALKGVTRKVISLILNDEVRRAEIFPNARRVEGAGRGMWQIPRAEAEAWMPNPHGWIKGRKRKND